MKEQKARNLRLGLDRTTSPARAVACRPLERSAILAAPSLTSACERRKRRGRLAGRSRCAHSTTSVAVEDLAPSPPSSPSSSGSRNARVTVGASARAARSWASAATLEGTSRGGAGGGGSGRGRDEESIIIALSLWLFALSLVSLAVGCFRVLLIQLFTAKARRALISSRESEKTRGRKGVPSSPSRDW